MSETPPPPSSPPPPPEPGTISAIGRRGALWWAMAILAGAAMLLSGYLTYASASVDGPPGCGAGSGCAQVLGSKWSNWFGIPVSSVSMVLYGLVLWLLLAARTWMPRRSATVWLLMLAGAGAMLGAAAWFTYIQLAIIQAVCPWCMTGHGLGVLLALLLIVSVLRMNPPKPGPIMGVLALIVGVASVALIAVPQAMSTERSLLVPGNRTGGSAVTPDSESDSDPGNPADESISLFDGLITIDPAAEPTVGPADAPHTVVAFMDYTCPHCRTAHNLLLERGDVRAVVVPVPLNSACNPYAPGRMPPRFDESCALNKLALEAHHFGKPTFETFDRWLFQDEDPPPADAARDHLAGLLISVTAPPADRDAIDQTIQRNVGWYGKLIANRIANRLPVVVHPGSGRTLIGRVYGPDDITELIEGTDAP